MDHSAVERAAELLAAAWRSRQPLAALDEASRPSSIADSHAVQDALLARLGEPVAGWKVTVTPAGEVMRGAILASRLFSSPAAVAASAAPLLGVESEIAFRFERALPARVEAYTMAEVREAVTALPAIEVVDTRFASYDATPVLDRLADFMSNGALVCGAAVPDWRRFDFSRIPVALRGTSGLRVDSLGGHANGDPLLPALALANELRGGRGIEAGQVVTTGTFTGLNFAKPGDVVTADFEGFGRAELRFTA